MNIVVCYKIVPDEQDAQVQADRTLSFERAALKIGDYDLNAVEAGLCPLRPDTGLPQGLRAAALRHKGKILHSAGVKACRRRGPSGPHCLCHAETGRPGRRDLSGRSLRRHGKTLQIGRAHV